VETLISNGFKEVVLTGINIGDFDGNRPEGEPADRLVDLVKAVDNVPGLERLRVSSIDPDEVDEDLMNAIIHGKIEFLRYCASRSKDDGLIKKGWEEYFSVPQN